MLIFRPALILTSLLSGMYSFVAWVGQLEVDAYVAALVGVLAAGGLVLIAELEHDRRRRMRQGRDREAGLS